MQKAVIFDIDGTLADNSNRQAILQKNKHDWKTFFEEMGSDTPNTNIVEIYNVLKTSNQYKMLIVTARPENYRLLTEQWLIWNNIEFDALYMRLAKDTRPDSVVKQLILEEIIKDFDIRFVFDDRSSVVKMWRDAGITCFQCYDHNY